MKKERFLRKISRFCRNTRMPHQKGSQSVNKAVILTLSHLFRETADFMSLMDSKFVQLTTDLALKKKFWPRLRKWFRILCKETLTIFIFPCKFWPRTLKSDYLFFFIFFILSMKIK
jgi:hypothetical protein